MDIGFLNRFEEKMQNELLRICTSHGMLEGVLLSTDDVNGRWDVLAPEYVADAVRQIADYPTVSVAWAGYLGLAVAHGWDKDWQECLKTPYKDYYGNQGFDDMDEYIVEHILGLSLDSLEAKKAGGCDTQLCANGCHADSSRADRTAEPDGLPCLCTCY